MREKLENNLINQQLLSQWRRDELDTIMHKIANKETIRFDQFNQIIDQEQIEKRLEQLNYNEQQIKTLFKLPANFNAHAENSLIVLAPFEITLQGRQGNLRGTINIEIQLVPRTYLHGEPEIRTKSSSIEQTVRHIAYTWRSASLIDNDVAKQRLAREIMRDLNYMLSAARVAKVNITNLEIEAE